MVELSREELIANSGWLTSMLDRASCIVPGKDKLVLLCQGASGISFSFASGEMGDEVAVILAFMPGGSGETNINDEFSAVVASLNEADWVSADERISMDL